MENPPPTLVIAPVGRNKGNAGEKKKRSSSLFELQFLYIQNGNLPFLNTMSLKELTDYQLYELIQNKKLDSTIRNSANNEFQARKLSVDQIQQVIAKHDAQFQPEKDEPLSLSDKIFLIAFPFLTMIQAIIAGKYLVRNERKKWRDFWLYICIGYLAWTVGIIIVVKLMRKQE